jgi:hypothetical protein
LSDGTDGRKLLGEGLFLSACGVNPLVGGPHANDIVTVKKLEWENLRCGKIGLDENG